MNIRILLISVLVFISLMSKAQLMEKPTVSDVNFRYNGKKIIIDYEIENYYPGDQYFVHPEIFYSNGNKIEANSFFGDFEEVTGGKKVIIWDYIQDNQEIEGNIYVKVYVKKLGQDQEQEQIVIQDNSQPEYKKKKRGNFWGWAGVGLAGTAIIMDAKAHNNLKKSHKADNLFESYIYDKQAEDQLNTSSILYGAAKAAFLAQFLKEISKEEQVNNSQPETETKIKTISETNDIVFSGVSNSKFVNTKVPFLPPNIQVWQTSIKFEDQNNNQSIDVDESCYISFKIKNLGGGIATSVEANTKLLNSSKGINVTNKVAVGDIVTGQTSEVIIPIRAESYIEQGKANFLIVMKEGNGFDSEPLEISVPVSSFLAPRIEIVDFAFSTENGEIPRTGIPLSLKAIVQNMGQGIAQDVKVNLKTPINVFNTSELYFSIGELKPGETHEIVFDFFANKTYKEKNINILAQISESHGKFAENKNMELILNQQFNTTEVAVINSKDVYTKIDVATLVPDVDKNIPETNFIYPNRFALIIGNEDYSSFQTGLSSESDVDFAKNDAFIFKEYCIKTLGVDKKNLYYLANATSAQINQHIELITKLLTKIGSESEVIFFYAGHGYPDEITQSPFLIPVDVTASNLGAAISLGDIYNKFGNSGARRVTIFLDACFSGSGRQESLLAARSVKIKPKNELLFGNTLVLAASNGDQTALPFNENKHGMFTYFLLKKIQETKGDVTYKELTDYIYKNVSIESLRLNKKDQEPQVNTSNEIKQHWKDWKLNE